MKLKHSLTSYTKTNSKWITDLNVRPDTTNLLEENTRVNLHDLEFGNGFLDMTLKAQPIKENKLDFIKIYNVWSMKKILLQR